MRLEFPPAAPALTPTPPRSYKYPRNVWSPVGGYWQENANWKRNTCIAFFFYAVACVHIFNVSRSKEMWYGTTPVTSWKWNTNPKSPHRRMVAEKEAAEAAEKEGH